METKFLVWYGQGGDCEFDQTKAKSYGPELGVQIYKKKKKRDMG